MESGFVRMVDKVDGGFMCLVGCCTDDSDWLVKHEIEASQSSLDQSLLVSNLVEARNDCSERSDDRSVNGNASSDDECFGVALAHLKMTLE